MREVYTIGTEDPCVPRNPHKFYLNRFSGLSTKLFSVDDVGRGSPLFVREHFAHFCMCMALYLHVISLVRYRVLHMQRQFKC